METRRAIVVGAGFAGLTAAHYLNKGGWQTTVLEAGDRVGGRVATVRKQGYILDTGATQISTGYKEYVALSRELGMDSEIVESSNWIAVLRHGRLYDIDGGSMLSGPLSPLLSIGSKLAMLKTIKDYLGLRPRMNVLDVSACAAYDIESAKQYALRRLNREIYDALIDPMIRAYVIHRADNVSCLEWFSSIGNLGGQQMTSLNGGNERLPLALASRLDVRLGSPVQSVRRSNQGVEVQYRDPAGQTRTLHADAAVIATRMPETIGMHPPFRAVAGALADELTYNRGLSVQLGFRVRPASRALGLLIPTVEHNEIGLVWLEHNKNPDRAPPGHALYSVYFDEAACDEWFHRPAEELADFCTGFLVRLFPELHGQRDMAHVTRWPLAVPDPATGIYAKVAAMKQRIDPRDCIQYAGDYFTCTGQNSAIYWGRRAAENLLGR